MTQLTKRQIECLRLSATMTDKDIARHLGISHHTVSLHVREAMRKLGVSGRKAALRSLAGNPLYASDGMAAMTGATASGGVTGNLDGPGDDLVRPRSLYDRYAGLGPWRTPPRWFGGRILLIVAVAAGILLVLGGALALLKVVFESVQAVRTWLA